MATTSWKGPLKIQRPSPGAPVGSVAPYASLPVGFGRDFTKVWNFSVHSYSSGGDGPTSATATTRTTGLLLDGSGSWTAANNHPIATVASGILTLGTRSSGSAQNDFVSMQPELPGYARNSNGWVDYSYTELVMSLGTSSSTLSKFFFGFSNIGTTFNTLEGLSSVVDSVGFAYVAGAQASTTIGLVGVSTAGAGTLTAITRATTPFSADGTVTRLGVLLKPVAVAEAAGGEAYFFVNRKHVGTISAAGQILVSAGTIQPLVWLKTEASSSIPRQLSIHQLSFAASLKDRNADGTAYTTL